MADDAVDLGAVLGLLRRRLGLIAIITALALAAAGIALVAIRPVYTATALILVDPGSQNLLDPEAPAPAAASARIDSEVELVRSPATLRAVAGTLALAGDREFGLQPGLRARLTAFFRRAEPHLPTGEAALNRVVDNLRDAVIVRRRGLTSLIAVSARSTRPAFAATLANTIARTYIGQQLEAKIAAVMQSRDIVKTRLTTAGPALASGQYQALLTRLDALDNQVFLQVADSRVVSSAVAPTAPSFPDPPLVLGLAGLAGLALGIGLAFLAENFVGGFISAAQAAAVLKVPVIAAVPLKRNGAAADAIIAAPLSIYSEAIRRLRIGVDQALRRREAPADRPRGSVVMVASAAPGEGKTTIALSLARAYALSGLKTLLIDADLRKPGVHQQLHREPAEGLLDYLGGGGDALDPGAMLTVDAGSGAHIMLGSRRADVATDQLAAGEAFSRLIAAARGNFDIVILDTPPVGPVVDGLYFAGRADAVLVVVKWAATPQQDVRTAIAALAAAADGAPLLAVLNQQQRNSALRDGYAGYYVAD